MVIQVRTESFLARAGVILAALAVSALLSLSALSNFIAGILSDPRVDVRRDLIAAGIKYVPKSATVSARLAAANLIEENRDLVATEALAERAANISPWDYKNRLLLATVKEAAGDRAAAERALRDALDLAPNYTDVHWRLANLLIREGKLSRAVPEFRIAVSSNPALLTSAHDLLWRVSGGNLAVVQAVTPKDPKSRLSLAQYLLKQSRASDAITVFAGIDRTSLVDLPESSAFIDSLITAGHIEEARGLWIGLVSGTYAQPGKPLPVMWNGGFESDAPKTLGQFDWAIARNQYANITVDSSAAHSGERSLRIDFLGRDTTRLDDQVKQTVNVRPGARYTLECWVKSEALESPYGPRVVVADRISGAEIASSSPVPSGSSDWRRIAIDFSAPLSSRALVVTIRRIPRFAYDDPTRGTVWYDDFSLFEESR